METEDSALSQLDASFSSVGAKDAQLTHEGNDTDSLISQSDLKGKKKNKTNPSKFKLDSKESRMRIDEKFYKTGHFKPTIVERKEERVVVLNDVKTILSKNWSERSEQDIKDLAIYFKDNPFFKNYTKEHGEAGTEMMYKVMYFEDLKEGDYVMRFGEVGTKFYIVLRGKVSIRVPSIVERNFEFPELLKLLSENQEWIVENERYQEIVKIVHDLTPELIKITLRGEMALNFELIKKVLNGKLTTDSMRVNNNQLPSFEKLRYKIEGHEAKGKERYLKLNLILEVAQLGKGVGFGELALIEDKPRAATILCLENTQFATLEKEDFNQIMGKVLRKKFAKDVEFVSNFPFLKSLTRKTKQKLCYPMEIQKFVLGQNVFTEAESTKYIYFLESGEFETSKNVYMQKEKDTVV